MIPRYGMQEMLDLWSEKSKFQDGLDVEIAACEAWGHRAGPEAVDVLSQALAGDPDIDIRLAAARALGKTGDGAAMAALAGALEDRDPALQYRAIRSLASVTDQNFGDDVNRWREYCRDEIPASPRPVIAAEKTGPLF